MNSFSLKFGVEVAARDEMIGHLQKVVVDSEITHVTHVIISQGLIFKQAMVLPLHLVQNAPPDEKVEIALHSDALSAYPLFEEYGFEEQGIEAGVPQGVQQPRMLSQNPIEPAISLNTLDNRLYAEAPLYVEKRLIREGVEPDDVLWDEHTAVYGRQGQVGHLSHVIVEASDGCIQKLVIRRDKLLQESLLTIPYELVEKSESGESVIHVALENSDFEELIEYARQAPQPAPVNGHSLPATPSFADDNAHPTASPSLTKTSNLTETLSAALAQDPSTQTAVIELIYDRGVVTLAGTVANQETKERAAALVKQHPDVISVQNSLQVSRSS